MNNQKHTLTATVGFVLAKGTKIHEAKTLDEVKEDAADILDAMHHLIKEFDLDESKVLTDELLQLRYVKVEQGRHFLLYLKKKSRLED